MEIYAKNRCYHLSAAALPIALMLVSAPSAFAQTENAPEEEADNGGEILVTAEKRATRLVDTPISIVAVNSEQLDRAGVNNLLELSTVVPGLRMDTIGNNSQPTIRGISSDVNGAGLSANVATYLDGFYLPSQQGNDFNLSDVTSVEVLKGPQGTLFGRNATGGAIRVNTAPPSYTTSGEVSLSYGSFDDMRGSLFVTGPISSNVAGSIYLHGEKTDSWTRDIVTGKNAGKGYKINARGKLLFDATDNLSFLATAAYTHLDAPEYKAWHTRGENTYATEGAIIAYDPYTASGSMPPRNEVENTQFTLTSTADLNFATLVSYTQYFEETTHEDLDLDGTSAAVLDLNVKSRIHTLSHPMTGRLPGFSVHSTSTTSATLTTRNSMVSIRPTPASSPIVSPVSPMRR
jgi:iron complex outermembrane receptor protein